MTNEVFIAVISALGAAGATVGAQALRDRADQRKAQTQVSGDVHKADLDFDKALMEMTMKRLELVEVRLAEAERSARAQDHNIAELKQKLERVGNQYETNRKLQRRVARNLRDNKPIDEDTLLELENAPDFSHVLAGPDVPRQLGEGSS